MKLSLSDIRVRTLSKWLVLAGLGICGVAFLFAPVSTRLTRAASLLYIATLWTTCLLLVWKRRPIRYGFAGFSLLALLLLVFPGRSYNPQQLREQYIRSLLAYKGARYHWGGESACGIDCSGLVRRGLINADLACGLKSVNPRLVRQGFYLWWHDCTARQLGKGYLALTDSVTSAASINSLDHALLLPGDFAVTRDGIHTMAYLGDSTWIEADPGLMRVITVRVPAKDNGWFRTPVDIMRWAPLR